MLVGLGLASGALSGFFGIGGGFLIVPALIFATGMPILNARRHVLVRDLGVRLGDRAELCAAAVSSTGALRPC